MGDGRVLPSAKTGREGIVHLGRVGGHRVPCVLVIERAVTRRMRARREPGPVGKRLTRHPCSQPPAEPACIGSALPVTIPSPRYTSALGPDRARTWLHPEAEAIKAAVYDQPRDD